MSREIKFRVWTGLSMEYNVVVGKDGAFYALVDLNDSASLSPTSKYNPNTPVMQFTGFKDDNGKDIYDGDVLLFGSDIKSSGHVFWDKNQNRWALGLAKIETPQIVPVIIYCNLSDIVGNNLFNVASKMVIGNIFE